ncbi:MAG: amidohydrolase family protein [Cyanobacteria bacterium]|nr:amidohydrolase family protein [Cyanobacteriota bacterium]MDA1021071.1 amidohydrolase family protein [Cyanobacteriota bacterium]
MLPNQYTHNIVIKNTDETLFNTVIEAKTSITDYRQINNNHIDKSNTKQIIIPGLINLHSHLAYSDTTLSSQSLFPWISQLVEIHHMGEASLPSAALKGAQEALSFGTSFLIDNTSHPEDSIKAFQESGLKGIIGIEIFGSDPKQATQILQQNLKQINKLNKPTNVDLTLSPHASYDVSPQLWQLCLDWCNQNQVPLLSHLAESAAEEAWFQDKDSQQAQSAKEFWDKINTLETKLANWQSYPSSTRYLHGHNLLKPFSLFTHLVHATKQDLELIKAAGIGIITCPRSNLYLKNGLANYQQWHKLAIDFAIGTDSKASNSDLDLRKEANAIPGLSAKAKFELITNKAAKLLKRDDLGSLDIGKAADWVVLEVQDQNIDLATADPFELIMDTAMTIVKQVYIDGNCRYQANS